MGQYLSWGANTALFTLCCFLAADTTNDVFGALLDPAPRVVAAEARPEAPSRRAWSERQVILSRNLFNSATLNPEPVVEEEPVEEIEATRLPLKLLGTTAATDPKFSWAAVENRQQRETLVVSLGDKVAANATVLKIERRRIILSENGSPRELTLDEEDPTAVKPRRVARRPSRRRESPAARVKRLGNDRFSVPREDVEKTMRNPANLFSQARILPKYEGGEMVGVQVNSIKDDSIFRNIGLQDGDVITELNGIAIDSPEQSARILQEFSEASNFTVSVDRKDGSSQVLDFEMQDE